MGTTKPDTFAFTTYCGDDEYIPGLTKREYFAAMALQGLMSTNTTSWAAARIAVQAADTLIKELNKEDKKED